MVLHAEVPQCATTVNAEWNPYIGMPGDVAGYRLLVRLEPFNDDYSIQYSTGPDGTLAYSFELPGGATHAHLMVEAYNSDGTLVSYSNRVSVERLTIDTAAFVEITTLSYDTLNNAIRLRFNTDTSYHGADHHTLWRSIDGSPWRVLDTGNWEEYSDFDINRYDSLHCYQLSIYDACHINEKFSTTACIVVPDPPEPGAYMPNVIVVGDPDNGRFLPQVTGLYGDLYELTIYDRRGLQVFTTTDPNAGWAPGNGTQQGAYVYTLRVRFATGIVKSYIGTLIVIK